MIERAHKGLAFLSRSLAVLVALIIAAPFFGCAALPESSSESGPRNVALYIGNSYTIGTGSSTGSAGLYEQSKGIFDVAYAANGSGTGFTEWEGVGAIASPTPENFLSQLRVAAQDETFCNEDITNVIIISAMGDTRAAAQGNCLSGLADTVAFIHEAFPNARTAIYYAEMIAEESTQSAFSQDYLNYQVCVDAALRDNAASLDYDYLGWGGYVYNLRPELLSDDGYHPNDMGYAALSSDLRERLLSTYLL